ncbi:MAG: ISAs1 family transposase [Moorea sp. SIO3I7]|uniref:ISAs1 family transposase n=1 Tax=unclassified Moorena TaxID=2683338 RepID=UPI0013B93396|nr:MULTISPECIES: ISAs1 family transposase [unclassified Moorena]NEO02346.1 ISAs1 family transposase [Moorena sp. SIO3I7]NEO64959.1 ISAs1 family transposase [Moorena sp. SIO4G2]NEQ87260.1 ISAs1 family transposase [Moorena sp. SIO2I5]NEO10588.1 ISAs1 family transposase [Moorena sp. SIO3I8]NEO20709.1 ISAs1 family transposase [Moorena sp. SIO4A5]
MTDLEEPEVEILRKSVIKHFQDLEDPRVGSRKAHSLVAIITIAILAILSGAEGFVGIETYGKAKQEWLETFVEIPNGIPSHDTFGRVLSQLEPEELNHSFLDWIGSITEKLNLELIHVDGKTAKGSYDRESKLKALHSVSAWSSEHGLVLAQQKVQSKSNEITAVPLLLKLVNFKGAVVTLDAMGTQREIAQQIKQGQGDYVLALKGNHPRLNQQVKTWFKQAQAQHWQGIDYSYNRTTESGHHRLETREVWAVPVNQLPSLHRQSQWLGLTTVVMVCTHRQLWNKTTTEVRFYISSLEADAQWHNQVIRSHWSIENSLHWVLDVTFKEDASRVRQGHGAENLGLLRRLSVNLLKREPSKQSLKMKRYRAGIDNSFLMKILSASVAES